ncbi:MAG: hypothetical protein ACXVEF_37925 [Polyangiales bacterium]
MAVSIDRTSVPMTPSRQADALRSSARQGYELLHWGFTAAPVLFGLDKFAHLMTNWDAYLSPAFAKLSPLSVHTTMLVVGVIEIAAGLIVALRPKIGGLVVAAWLFGIIVNLALLGHAWDVALRDFGLMLGALALSRLAVSREQMEIP